MNFSDYLKKWNGGRRTGAKAKFAKTLGVVPSTVSMWSKGMPPGEDSLHKIAAEFKISFAEATALWANPVPAGPSGELDMLRQRVGQIEDYLEVMLGAESDESGVIVPKNVRKSAGVRHPQSGPHPGKR